RRGGPRGHGAPAQMGRDLGERGVAVTSLTRERAARYTRAARRGAGMLLTGTPETGVRVFYGHDRVPGPGEPVAGGTAKFQRLAARFPNDPVGFSLLALVSTWLPRDLGPLLWHARRRGVPLLVNQNGVGYPGWAGEGSGAVTPPRASIRRAGC